jgi:alpha-glucosidase (family GH31 glycosyl hydrolase)
MLNTECASYSIGLNNSYYLNDGATIDWWHGTGSLIDYTNPNAMNWWHSQMDNVLRMGIDGWKVDATDPYVFELILPYGYGGKGLKNILRYSNGTKFPQDI